MEIPGNPGVAPKGTIRREARTGDLQDHRPRPRPVEGPRRWRVASDEPLAEARSPLLQLHEPPGGHEVSPEAFSPRPAEEDPHLVALTLPAVLPDDEGPAKPQEAIDAGDEPDEAQEPPGRDVSPRYSPGNPEQEAVDIGLLADLGQHTVGGEDHGIARATN